MKVRPNRPKKNSMQNDNTSISDSEICQTTERLERLAESLNIPKSNQITAKINSPQNTISVESQTENIQNDNTSDSDSETCQFVEEMVVEIMQNDNTPDTDSETCQLVEEMVRDLRQDLTVSEKSHQLWTNFKPVEKNQINSHQQKDLSPSKKKQQDSKKRDSKDKKKRSYKSKSMKIKSVQRRISGEKNLKVMVNLTFRRKKEN